MRRVTAFGAGVIGLGVGERHARAYDRLDRARLVALCDQDADQLAAVGARFPGARRYARAEDLIDDPDVAVVSVASYDQDHAAQILRALDAGKHVFAEKPLCLTLSELDAIRAAWRRQKGAVRLSANTVLRRSPRFQWLRAEIAAGALGTVYCVEADYVYGRLHKLTEGWRGRIPGYSVMLGGGVHLVDLILWMTGQRPAEVSAYGSGLASRRTAFQGNDLVLAALQFESGLLAKVGANFACMHPHFHRLVLYGTEATFENAPEHPTGPARLWTTRDPADAPAAIDVAYPGLDKGDMIPAFLSAIAGDGESDAPEDDVFAAMAVCLAIDRAVAEKRAVRPDY